jgi:hypothetical protein
MTNFHIKLDTSVIRTWYGRNLFDRKLLVNKKNIQKIMIFYFFFVTLHRNYKL